MAFAWERREERERERGRRKRLSGEKRRWERNRPSCEPSWLNHCEDAYRKTDNKWRRVWLIRRRVSRYPSFTIRLQGLETWLGLTVIQELKEKEGEHKQSLTTQFDAETPRSGEDCDTNSVWCVRGCVRSPYVRPQTCHTMNGLSLSELCCLFCCPPCPSRIADKLAFLPPEPTYTFVEDEGSKFTISLSERAEWQYTEREKESVEGFYARTSRGNRIACLFVRCSATARFTILFSHGNAVDLGQMSSFYLGLGSRINCNIFSYDYSGYGVSGGKPSEKNLYADIDAAWHALRTRYGISPENIILYGQSIGTVPTVDLAARYEVGAVVLHSPLMSGMRVAFPKTKRTWFFDAFTR